jgi:protein SCO1/2
MNAASSSMSRRDLFFGRGLSRLASSGAPARFLGPGSHAATGFTDSDRASRRMPDCVVQSHREETLRFVSDLLSDQRVILGFIYTRCDGICPTTTRNMAATYRILKERNSAPFRMISLSVDPVRDNADDLARYAARYGLADIPEWRFVVASVADTLAIRKALRLTDPDPKRDGELNNHSGLLVMGNDRTNRWGGIPSGSDPSQIAGTFDRIARTVSLQEYAGFGRPS